MPSDFGSVEFWDATAIHESQYGDEWIANFGDLVPLLRRCCDASTTVLHAGCGISSLSQSMYDDPQVRCHHQLAMDFSEQCIRRQRALCGHHRPGLATVVMDCTRLGLRDRTVDVVLDKSTVDAMLCSEDGEEAVRLMVQEVRRVLRPRGLWLVVSLSAPEVIVPILTDAQGPSRTQPAMLLACRCIIDLNSTTYIYVVKVLDGEDAIRLRTSENIMHRARRGWMRAVHDTDDWLTAIGVQECLALGGVSSAGDEIAHAINEERTRGPCAHEFRSMLLQHQLIPAIGRDAAPVVLYLVGCHLTALPDVFSHLSQLRMIDCRRNQLATLPCSMCSAVALETLRLDHNLLQELPADIDAFVRLRTLSVSHNRLSELPPSWKQLTSTLKCLRLHCNPLSDTQLAELHDCTVARIDGRQRARLSFL